MRLNATDRPALDRRSFFQFAIGGASLAAGVAGGAVLGVDRRAFVPMAAAGAGVAAVIATGSVLSEEASAAPGEPLAGGRHLPMPAFDDGMDTADIIVETLVMWGATHAFGAIDDDANPIVAALRRRGDRIRYIRVLHEESAAFMASGFARHTGHLGVCVGTSGPRASQLMNGLYEACLDGAPVIAISSMTAKDVNDASYRRGIDTASLMRDFALYHVEVTGPGHAIAVADHACRAALGERRVAHLAIADDVLTKKLSGHRGLRGRASSPTPLASRRPPAEQLQAAADILNSGHQVTILCGQGALLARDEVLQIADALGAPVVKTLFGKAVLADDSPFTTGEIGEHGTPPSAWAMKSCDTLLILGTTMPSAAYYPEPGRARAVQIDLRSDRLGLHFPVEVGMTGDVKATLRGLLPLLTRQPDRDFLREAQRRMADWNRTLDAQRANPAAPPPPWAAIKAVSDLIDDNAVISLDCGADAHFWARHLRLRPGQRLIGTGLQATTGPGLPCAIAARIAYPSRQSVAIVGDSGFAMLMGELTTAARLGLPVKVIVLKRASATAGPDLDDGSDSAPIDFVAVARSCGAEAFHCDRSGDLNALLRGALSSPNPALVEIIVRADEKQVPVTERAGVTSSV